MKKSWFFFPLGYLFRWMGGIPVARGSSSNESSVDNLVNLFNSRERLSLAITPEGTRSLTTRWHSGFLNIARQANLPIILAAIDFKRKIAVVEKTVYPSDNIDADLRAIKDYYRQFTGRYPEKFSTD